MGVNAVAILLGHIQPVQIAQALRDVGYEVETQGSDEDRTILLVDGPDTDRRSLWVFGKQVSSYDYQDVFAGEKTLCSLGATGKGPAMVQALAERFGGYHRPRDDGEWTAAPGSEPVHLDARDTLLFTLQKTLPMQLAFQVHKVVADDPEALDGVRQALETYAESAASTPAP